MSTTVDYSAVMKTLQSLEKELTGSEHRRAFNRAARKGGNILKIAVRSLIVDNNKFEHINFIRRNVKVITSKSRINPGVNVYIKGPDVPVGQGKSRRFWKLSSYSVLVFKGNYKNPGRLTKTHENRGDVEGITHGNPLAEVARINGKLAIDKVIQHLLPEIKKEIDKKAVKNK